MFKCAAMTAILICSLSIGCKKEAEPIEVSSTTEHLEEINFMTENWGFKREQISIQGDNFCIDECMLVPIKDFMKNYGSMEQTQAEGTADDRYHRKTFYLVYAPWPPRWIPVHIQSNVPNEWRTAVYNAINEWNALNGKVKFYGVNANSIPSGGVCVTMNTLGGNNWASGFIPSSNGNPGQYLFINSLYSYQGTAGKKKLVIAHELGHTIGFLHTDTNDGFSVNTVNYWCNNSYDSYSVMCPGGGGNTQWQGFSACDQYAFNALYGW